MILDRPTASAPYFIYDGSAVIAESTAPNTVSAYYTPGIDQKRNGFQDFFRENALGSTLQMLNSGDLIADRFEYDAYGITYTFQQNRFTPYKFAGKHGYYSDSDSGMNLLGHRYYLPLLGRFLTQDPIGHGAGLNLYQYVGNNPLVKTDPNGTDAVVMWGRNKANRGYFRDLAKVYAANYERTPLAVVESWRSHHPVAHIFHVESVADIQKALSTPNIDTIIYLGHAGAGALYLSDQKITAEQVSELSSRNVTPGAHILLAGCDTAGYRYQGPSMAQAFADRFRTGVSGADGGLSFGLPFFGIDWYPGMLRAANGMKTVYPHHLD